MRILDCVEEGTADGGGGAAAEEVGGWMIGGVGSVMTRPHNSVASDKVISPVLSRRLYGRARSFLLTVFRRSSVKVSRVLLLSASFLSEE